MVLGLSFSMFEMRSGWDNGDRHFRPVPGSWRLHGLFHGQVYVGY